jgi:hypothetical protein
MGKSDELLMQLDVNLFLRISSAMCDRLVFPMVCCNDFHARTQVHVLGSDVFSEKQSYFCQGFVMYMLHKKTLSVIVIN